MQTLTYDPAGRHGLQAVAVVDVGGRDADDQGQSVRVRQDVHLGTPAYPGPRGSDRCVRPLFRPHVRRVEHDPRDVDQAGIIQSMQHRLVQPAPHPDPRPDDKPAVRGRFRDLKARRQRPPGTTADQHINDRREHRLIRRVWRTTALRAHPRRRNQRFGDLP